MYLRYTFRQMCHITVFPQLSEPLGTKTCSNNQKVWIIKQIYMKSIITVILYSQVISLLVGPLSRYSHVVMLSPIDKIVRL